MAKYLVTHEATVGRTVGEGAVIQSILLTFYSMLEASSVDAAKDELVAYSDPGFKTRVVDVVEVADPLSNERLFELLDHKKIIKEGL
jgi:hypothetical protein